MHDKSRTYGLIKNKIFRFFERKINLRFKIHIDIIPILKIKIRIQHGEGCSAVIAEPSVNNDYYSYYIYTNTTLDFARDFPYVIQY